LVAADARGLDGGRPLRRRDEGRSLAVEGRRPHKPVRNGRLAYGWVRHCHREFVVGVEIDGSTPVSSDGEDDGGRW
jgi:hypothetical protein